MTPGGHSFDPGAPVGQLAPQDWMNEPGARAVTAALTAGGAEVRFVGGCVRDAILKRPVRDIDIATPDAPEAVMLLLEQAGIKVIPTGVEHGTVTAVAGGRHFEITTLRRDVETDGRHARVAFTDDWAADAARRDFTINALYADLSGRVYDYFDGLQDLGAGRIRFVGDPKRRIEEDVLRLLRFFRFQAWYGQTPIDPATLAVCRWMAPELARLSGERVRGELMRLLAASEPASMLKLMHGERILEPVLPEAAAFGRLRVIAWLEERGIVHGAVVPDTLRRLAALLDTGRAGACAVGERLRLSNAETRRLMLLCAPPHDLHPDMDRKQARAALYRLGAPLFRDLVLLAWAGRMAVEGKAGPGETENWRALLDEAAHWPAPRLPVRGRDVLDLGLGSGPGVGALLQAVEAWWIAGDFQAGREACLEKLRALARETPVEGSVPSHGDSLSKHSP